MDDLTRINGIGPATARALAAAGIDSIAALSMANPAELAAHDAFSGLRASPGDLENWIAEAQQIAGKPVALQVAQDGEGSVTGNPPDSAVTQSEPPAVSPELNTESGEDSAQADAAESAEPQHRPPEVPGATGAGEADSKTPPPAPAPDAPNLDGFTLIVTGPKRGRRRAGMVFDATPTRIAAATLTPGQIEALRDDPVLSVEVEPAAGD